MDAKIRSYRSRFDGTVDVNILENPLVPRQSENAAWLLDQRYLLDRHDGEIGSVRKERDFEEFARRISRVIASVETLYRSEENLEWIRTLEKNLFSDILNRRFLFNSPCLFGAGAGMTVQSAYSDLIYRSPDSMSYDDYVAVREGKTESQQLFACFVVSVEDSIEGIFGSVKDAAIISKYGGGVGANFGNLRESGSDIKGGTGGKASGPVSFMETWNTMGSVVVQGGRRRAALMGMLYDDHPDIEGFMDAKVEDGRLPYFNISVSVSDRLLESAKKGGDFDLVSRADGSVVRKVKAADLWDKLCKNAWRRGDPGVFFGDRANVDNMLKLDKKWRIESTNPCGEQPLPNYTSCNLGSVNLEAFVSTEATGARAFDMEAFVDQVYRSVYYLDLVIDGTSYPLDQIAERTKAIRPVGLGLMGLADAAITLGMVYGSDQFDRFCRSLAQNMAVGALAATVELTDLGKDPFPEHHLVSRLMEEFRTKAGLPTFSQGWLEGLDEKGFKEVIERMGRSDLIPFTLVNTLEGLLGATAVHRGNGPTLAKKVLASLISGRMRNSRRLSVAPTGSISMLFDASPGIEPNFAWTWSRKVMSAKGDGGYETREYFHPLVPSNLKEELRETGRLGDPRFVTAYDIGTDAHVTVTGIFASVVDSGISKTVNLPPEATVEDVKKVYEDCYRLGCKGITIYRDGSRSEQPIEAKKPEAPKASDRPMSSKVKARPGNVMFGKTIKDTTPWGSLYVTLNYDGDEPFEVFASLGKSGSEMKSMTEALSRVISIGLRSGGRMEDFINTLRGISGKEYWVFDCDEQTVVRSIPDGVALLMEKLSGVKGERPTEVPRCPECDSPMELVGGCEYCFSCGYSPCK